MKLRFSLPLLSATLVIGRSLVLPVYAQPPEPLPNEPMAIPTPTSEPAFQATSNATPLPGVEISVLQPTATPEVIDIPQPTLSPLTDVSPASGRIQAVSKATIARVQLNVGGSWYNLTNGATISHLLGTQARFRALDKNNNAIAVSWSGPKKQVGTDAEFLVSLDTLSNSTSDVKTISAKSANTFSQKIVVGEVGLDRVDFMGNTPILKDDGSGFYSPTEWSKGATAAPLCYYGGQKIRVQSYFWARPSGFDVSVVKTQGVATGTALNGTAQYTFTAYYLSRNGGDNVYPASDTTAMATTSNVLDPLHISWQVLLNHKWSEVGVSSNKLYRTWKKAADGTPLYHTVVDVACRNVRGISGEANIVSGIWYAVKDRNVGNAQGRAMKYWANSSESLRIALASQSCQGLEEMIHPGPRIIQLRGTLNPATGKPYQDDMTGVGTCAAWSQLFKFALRAQGIAKCAVFELRPAAIFASEGRDGVLLVKKWFFNANGNAPSDSRRVWTHLATEIADLPGLPAQGGVSDPPGGFDNHFIVGYGGEYYDPSYGGGGPYSPQEWENASVAGFANNWKDTKVAKENNTSVPEIQFTVLSP